MQKTESEIYPLSKSLEIMETMDQLRALWNIRKRNCRYLNAAATNGHQPFPPNSSSLLLRVVLHQIQLTNPDVPEAGVVVVVLQTN